METANIISISQSGDGVSWSALSNMTDDDSRYVYAILNGFNRENAKPKSIVAEARFDVNSYDHDTDELFLEYKLYVDDGSQSVDGFSYLKHPDIRVNFSDGTSCTIDQEDYCNDNYRDDYLVRNVKIDEELSLEMLNNTFDVILEFDLLDSVSDRDIIVYCDYLKMKLVSSLPSDEWNTHLLPFQVMPQNGFTLDADMFEKEYGAYGETIGFRDLPINESFAFQYKSKNLRDGEYTLIQLDDGMTFDESRGIMSENCRLDYDANTKTIKIYSAERTSGELIFFIKLTRLHSQNLSVTTNYQDFTRVYKFNGTTPCISENVYVNPLLKGFNSLLLF